MFRGSICALVTPFSNGEVDKKALKSLVDWHVKQGTHGLVPCGTTGESPTLSHDEDMEVVRLTVEAADGRVPVIAGAGSNSTQEAIELSRAAQANGADAVLIVTPYYNKPSQEGLFQHFKAIHDAIEVPVVIYNIPGRSIIDMSVDTMARLAELPRIVGVKDATGDPVRPTLTRNAIGKEFCQLSGEDGSALAFMAHGGHGCISVTANVAPAECAAFQNACMSGDFKTALDWQDKLMPLHSALFVETSPSPVKYAMSLRGLCSDEVRLPLVPVSEATKKRVRDALQQLGLLNED